MPYNPRLGQYSDNGSGSLSSGSLSDVIRRIRETVHDHTPGPLTASSLVLGAPGLAAGGAIRAMPTLARTASSLMGNAGMSPAAMVMPSAAQAPSLIEPAWQKFKDQADAQAELKPAVPLAPTAMPWMIPPPQTPAPAPTAPQAATVPMSQARPAGAAPQVNPDGSIAGALGPTSVGGAPLVGQAAPQAQPDTSFFMRNALMQRDPVTGALIDPSGAASVSGPDLIQKMMAYLHNK
ncbi:hypothetical protein ACVIJW_000298 [Bradyrhizobium barranii subsp. barranii]